MTFPGREESIIESCPGKCDCLCVTTATGIVDTKLPVKPGMPLQSIFLKPWFNLRYFFYMVLSAKQDKVLQC